mmetsp:Transcript_124376/g.310987  ORF Transcript_124376/g.310987 Transcript_124376/m.310987 type:complete len:162 (-) Transcript_124376:751-1236(-)
MLLTSSAAVLLLFGGGTSEEPGRDPHVIEVDVSALVDAVAEALPASSAMSRNWAAAAAPGLRLPVTPAAAMGPVLVASDMTSDNRNTGGGDAIDTVAGYEPLGAERSLAFGIVKLPAAMPLIGAMCRASAVGAQSLASPVGVSMETTLPVGVLIMNGGNSS